MIHLSIVLMLIFSAFQPENSACLALENPSFELDKPARSRTPTGWKNMANSSESPNDIHGNEPAEAWFGVQTKTAFGNRFIGLVTRSNFTSEAIGQRLARPLERDSSYQFSLYLARSPSYESFDRKTGEPANYNQPTVLKIWGAARKSRERQLLAESMPVKNEDWRLFEFTLKPADFDCRWLILEASFEANSKPYNGNLLIDNCSLVCLKKGGSHLK